MLKSVICFLALALASCSKTELPQPWTSAVFEREAQGWKIRVESFRSKERARQMLVRLTAPPDWPPYGSLSRVQVDGIWCEYDRRADTYTLKRAYTAPGVKQMHILARELRAGRKMEVRLELHAYDDLEYSKRTEVLRGQSPSTKEELSAFLRRVRKHGDRRLGLKVASYLTSEHADWVLLPAVMDALDDLRAIEAADQLWPVTKHKDILMRAFARSVLGTFMHANDKVQFKNLAQFGAQSDARAFFKKRYESNLKRFEGTK